MTISRSVSGLAITALLLSLSVATTGCDTDSTVTPTTLTVHFDIRSGALPVRCDAEVLTLGSSASTWTPADLRFYVSELALITSEGDEVPAVLVNDGLWQNDTVALLDLEDKTGRCTNGTEATNSAVTVVVADPSATYTGVAFTLGVPAALNHQDAANAASPLNLGAMFWNWQGGYKHLRLDGDVVSASDAADTPWNLHVGSTGCTLDDAGVASCNTANRSRIVLDTFDAQTDLVVLDIAPLLAGVDLAATGSCQSMPATASCPGPFSALGLGYGNVAAEPQTVFRAETRQ